MLIKDKFLGKKLVTILYKMNEKREEYILFMIKYYYFTYSY